MFYPLLKNILSSQQLFIQQWSREVDDIFKDSSELMAIKKSVLAGVDMGEFRDDMTMMTLQLIFGGSQATSLAMKL